MFRAMLRPVRFLNLKELEYETFFIDRTLARRLV